MTIKETIADLFEFDKMAPEKAAEMLNRVGKIIFEAILVRVLPILSEEDFSKYEKIVDSKEGGEVIYNFLSEKVPGFEKIVREEAEILREELSQEFSQAKVK